MRLWNLDDPHGIATARRTLLWFAFALIFIAANRVLRRGDPLEPFVWLIAGLVAFALLLEPVLDLLRPSGKGQRRG